MQTAIIALGAWGTVELLTEPDPGIQEALARIPKADRAALARAFEHLGASGRIINETRFKQVAGTRLFEFKRHKHRLLGFFVPDAPRFLIVAYELKKRAALRSQTVARALRFQKQLFPEGSHVRQ